MLKNFWMKVLPVITILAALGSIAAGPIGTLGSSSTVSVGGRTLVGEDSSTGVTGKLVVLYGLANNNSTTKFSSLREGNGSGGYQVPTGQKLVLVGAFVHMAQLSGGDNSGKMQLNFGYSDNDVGFNANSTGGTNQVWIASNSTGLFIPTTATQVNRVPIEIALDFEVPASKYPSYYNEGVNTATSVTVYGVLRPSSW
jgi:hypothetical protein